MPKNESFFSVPELILFITSIDHFVKISFVNNHIILNKTSRNYVLLKLFINILLMNQSILPAEFFTMAISFKCYL